MKQHKWHKEIKAWADGAEIEARNREGYNNPNAEFAHWWTIKDPHWETHNDIEYRIKPQPVEPQYLYVYANNDSAPRFFWNEITPLKTDLTYQGKIPLIVESNDD